MSKLRLLSIVLLSAISESWGQVIPANIIFYRSDGQSYPTGGLLPLEVPDMSMATELVTFLTPPAGVTIIACATGIWRFFPLPTYEVVNPSVMGYQLGANDKEICYNVGTGIELRGSRSYRSISEQDLNLDAIHIFTETYGGGSRKTLPPYATDGEDVEANIPSLFGNVRSFAITGAQPSTPDATGGNTPVIKIMSDPLGNPANGAVCFILNGQISATEIGRMHFQQVMRYVDDADGLTKELTMGSFRHFTLDLEGAAPTDCPVRSTVGQLRTPAFGIPQMFERVENFKKFD